MESRLIIASSETDADMYYASRMLAPDEFIYLETKTARKIYVSDLEFSRALREAKADEVFNLSSRPQRFKDAISWIIAENDITEVTVPANFPIAYAEVLRKKKIKIRIGTGAFFPEREAKNEEEIRDIIAVQKVNEKAMRAAIGAIRKSFIRQDNKLSYGSRILTSEILKEMIEIEFVRGGCKSENDIVSCGPATSQPHHSGRGPILAHQPIIIDIYPRSSNSRYFADMTRTVVKGKASPEIKKMHQAVLAGQRIAISQVRAGTEIRSLFNEVNGYFEKSGFKTETGSRNPEGFIHNLGHGVGLEIHERPFLGPKSEGILKTGNVITIEPGLYYPDTGGVRIEDMVLVEQDGCLNLTSFPKFLEIK